MGAFKTARPDGRSNGDVLVELLRDGAPEAVYTFDQLSGALSYPGRKFTRRDVQGAIVSCGPRILKGAQRALRAVANVGYQLVRADEHTGLAESRRRRASRQMQHGLRLLKEVRWTEMSPSHRKAHEATLMVVSALAESHRALERRVQTIEDVMAKAGLAD